MTSLLTLTASPQEVERLIDVLDDSALVVQTSDIHESKPEFEFKARLRVDPRAAKPRYFQGALEYGPIQAELFVDLLKVRIDWHRALGIGHEVCLHIKDPCGNTIIKECWDFDLGVSELVLLDNVMIPFRGDIKLLDLAFRDMETPSHFALTGDIPIAGFLAKGLLEGFVRGALAMVANAVERLLRQVIGNSDIARLIIKLIKKIFAIIDKALDFVGDLVRDVIYHPIDEWLHDVFGEKLEVVLMKEAFPRNIEVIGKEGSRPAVAVQITNPPEIDLGQNGLKMEVLS